MQIKKVVICHIILLIITITALIVFVNSRLTGADKTVTFTDIINSENNPDMQVIINEIKKSENTGTGSTATNLADLMLQISVPDFDAEVDEMLVPENETE